jgi:hypothetical protein
MSVSKGRSDWCCGGGGAECGRGRFTNMQDAVMLSRKERTCLVVSSGTVSWQRASEREVSAARRVVRCGRSSGLSGELFWGWGWFLGHISECYSPLPHSETTVKTPDWPNPPRANLFLADSRRSLHDHTSERGHGPALLSRR